MGKEITSIQIESDVADMLHGLKDRGQSYSDIIRILINNYKKTKK